jgi:hypothetical protein
LLTGAVMLAAVIIIIALIWFAIVSPGFRSFLLCIAALCAIGIGVAVINANRASQQREKQQAAAELYALSAINVKDLVFTDVLLKPSLLAYWTLEGVVANNSKHYLDTISFKVTMKDCEDKAVLETCRIVGQVWQNAKSEVPAGQTRAFQTYAIEFKNLPKDVVRTCQKPPCNPGRIYEWEAVSIRARYG